MEMTPQAKKLWDKVPANIRVKLLNNVYCLSCKGTTSIAQIQGVVEKGDLILRGTCTKCGEDVARVIESN